MGGDATDRYRPTDVDVTEDHAGRLWARRGGMQRIRIHENVCSANDDCDNCDRYDNYGSYGSYGYHAAAANNHRGRHRHGGGGADSRGGAVGTRAGQ